MKNYAGHRLSPWLGHLMVSRQETARPLMTPGEIMQLPSDDEIVMVAGVPPIRAKKARYYEDRRLFDRVQPPLKSRETVSQAKPNDWSKLAAVRPTTATEAYEPLAKQPDPSATGALTNGKPDSDPANPAYGVSRGLSGTRTSHRNRLQHSSTSSSRIATKRTAVR